ncbi:MAG: hypothetical protein M3178_17745 [Pseudomonadota bacterium]|nr:hypothetical protein [Pseudomonadota bacterium]
MPGEAAVLIETDLDIEFTSTAGQRSEGHQFLNEGRHVQRRHASLEHNGRNRVTELMLIVNHGWHQSYKP